MVEQQPLVRLGSAEEVNFGSMSFQKPLLVCNVLMCSFHPMKLAFAGDVATIGCRFADHNSLCAPPPYCSPVRLTTSVAGYPNQVRCDRTTYAFTTTGPSGR
jgi:hypothetical protein